MFIEGLDGNAVSAAIVTVGDARNTVTQFDYVSSLPSVLFLFPYLSSCGRITTVCIDTVDFAITSPRTGWAYHGDTKIMLAVNADTNEVRWESDADGSLGEGNHLTVSMPRAGIPVDAVGKRSRSYDAHGVGDRRTFLVVNTANQLGEPHRLEAEMIYGSDTLAVWFPVGDPVSDLVNECVIRIESHIVPRIVNIWGSAADIDDDGRIAILFSQTINDEGLAIGFFNLADFFEFDGDAHSGSYNPASNELDIIYVAMPEA